MLVTSEDIKKKKYLESKNKEIDEILAVERKQLQDKMFIDYDYAECAESKKLYDEEVKSNDLNVPWYNYVATLLFVIADKNFTIGDIVISETILNIIGILVLILFIAGDLLAYTSRENLKILEEEN